MIQGSDPVESAVPGSELGADKAVHREMFELHHYILLSVSRVITMSNRLKNASDRK